ncbi:hypothetical protein SteCoe_23246 [Stentor coeruleus]|uniref:Histidine phosphatase family protein n=1 Tax=Stentor coeruleus TaxID=5963 RepID=A0A1R2BKF3_9CILI|nr:hypothetical protein SteCoe_23246 [Stentor coeruleus]
MSFITSKHNPATGLKIYFIRHAESLNNIRCHDDLQGYEHLRSHDPDLSPRGYEQASQLAQFIRQHEQLGEVSEIHCSAMFRSLLTAQALQKELGINPEIWLIYHEVKGCRELNRGFPGMSRQEITERFPGFIIPDGVTDAGWFLRDDSESEEEGWVRSKRVWDRLRHMGDEEKYQGKSIIIITHGLFMDFLIGRVCNREMKGEPRFVFFNTGYSLVWVKHHKPIVYFLDRIEHLAVMPLMYHEGELE